MSGRMSSIDAAWLHMETPDNLMMITAVLAFRGRVERARLRALVAERLVGVYPRFSQRVVEPRLGLGATRWEDEAAFDLDAHLVDAGEVADTAALQALVGELMSTRLDHARPLWELHLVRGPGDASAMIARLHHCIADGISLARVLLQLTDEYHDADAAPPMPPGAADGHLFDVFYRPSLESVGRLVDAAQQAVAGGWDLLTHPARVARLGLEHAAALARLLTLPPEPDTSPLKRPIGPRKRAAWTAPMPLDDVKAVGSALGGTVNDVLLSAMTGALGRFLAAQGCDAGDVRTFVPVNLRPLDQPVPRELGNQFSLVFLDLPVGVRDPRARVAVLRERMAAIKASQEPAVAWALLRAMGVTPPAVERLFIEHFGRRACAVMTNVPGPRAPIHLAGHEVSDILFWVPQSGRIGLGVSIFSYAGEVVVGVAGDARVVPDPADLAADFEAEVAALRAVTAAPEASA